jgi:regulator of protease activity HflC (stomatin/prohibitin superfamily)
MRVIQLEAYVLGSIRVLRQYERGVVFLLGKFEGVRGAGLTFVFVPIPIQQMVRVSLPHADHSLPLVLPDARGGRAHAAKRADAPKK